MKTRHTRFRLRTPDGTLLAVTQHWPARSPYAVVFCGSLSGSQETETVQAQLAEILAEHQIGSLRFDYREHGESDAGVKPFSPLATLEDLSTVVGYARSKKPVELGLLGASFGGAVASLYAGRYPEHISALCLHNPVLDFETAFLKPIAPWAVAQFGSWKEELDRMGYVFLQQGKIKLGKSFFLEMMQLRPFQELQQYTSPLLILHGTADTKVPVFETKKIYDLLGNRQKQFIPVDNAEHGFFHSPHKELVLKRSLEFFKQTWQIL